MSDRICFVGKKEDIVLKSIEIPSFLGDARYEDERNCIFTYIKTVEIYGDRLYGIRKDVELLALINNWAKEHELLVTSDYHIKSIGYYECPNCNEKYASTFPYNIMNCSCGVELPLKKKISLAEKYQLFSN